MDGNKQEYGKAMDTHLQSTPAQPTTINEGGVNLSAHHSQSPTTPAGIDDSRHKTAILANDLAAAIEAQPPLPPVTSRAGDDMYNALQNDKVFVLEAIKQDISALKYVSDALKNDKGFVLEAVKQNGYAFRYASKELQADRDFVLEAVKQNGSALEYAVAFQGDKDVVLEAVKNFYPIRYVSIDLRSDKNFVLEAVKQNGYAFRYASKELQADRDFVLEAVKQDGRALQYASKALQADRDFVLDAVKQNGLALEHAVAFQGDKDVVLEAVKQDISALKYASDALKKDRMEINLVFKGTGGSSMKHLNTNFKEKATSCIVFSGAQAKNIGRDAHDSRKMNALINPNFDIFKKNFRKCYSYNKSNKKFYINIEMLKETFGSEVFISQDLLNKEKIHPARLKLEGYSRGGYQAVLLANELGTTTKDSSLKIAVKANEPTPGYSWIYRLARKNMSLDFKEKLCPHDNVEYDLIYRNSKQPPIIHLDDNGKPMPPPQLKDTLLSQMPFFDQWIPSETEQNQTNVTTTIKERASHWSRDICFHQKGTGNTNDIQRKNAILKSIEFGLGLSFMILAATMYIAKAATTAPILVTGIAAGIIGLVSIVAANSILGIKNHLDSTKSPTDTEYLDPKKACKEIYNQMNNLHNYASTTITVPVAIGLALSSIVLGLAIGSVKELGLGMMSKLTRTPFFNMMKSSEERDSNVEYTC